MRSGAAKFSLPVILAFLAVAIPGSPARQDMSVIVQTPPMGWNSWDAWGYTINESQFRDSVTWFHNNLQRFSWQYVVIDEGWFAQHPENPAGHQDYTLSDDGRYMPAVNRFPSSAGGKGFRPLSDWVHSASSSAFTSCAASRVKPSVATCASQARISPPPMPPTPPIPASGTRTITV